jgi:hypothetical protein
LTRDPAADPARDPKLVDPKWLAVGARIVPCGACGRDDEVIYRLRHSADDIFVYRCREHAGITDPTDAKQVEW